MTRKYFGTDGIRGKVGEDPLTPTGVADFARAVAGWVNQQALPAGRDKHLVLVGGDTRKATPWLRSIVEGTRAAHGVDVAPLFTWPTPGVAFETRGSEATAGIMITASHNKAGDNGLKLFGADGFKLSDADEAAIEAGMSEPEAGSAKAEDLGLIDELWHQKDYVVDLISAPRPELSGVKLVLDTAHGATSHCSSYVMHHFGVDLISMANAPNGLNINDGVGATHPEVMAATVVETGAYAGVSFDGDGDRLIMCDETGGVVDGDQLIALLARDMASKGTLEGGAVAATVMSNLGLERYLAGIGVELVRTPVGDRHVVQAMRERGLNLGGEQSGHIVMLDHGTTGDGLAAALEVLSIAARDGRKYSEISSVFEPVPQKLVNVRFAGENPLDSPAVQQAITAVSDRLGSDGRVLVRKSGTEPLIRIMAEAIGPEMLQSAMDELERAVQEVTQTD